MPVITTFGGMSARGFGLFSGGSLQLATSFITIDGTSTNVSTKWQGGSTPSSGNSLLMNILY